MSEILSSTPAVSSNPVSLTVTDISDSVPVCHEDADVFDLDDLLEEPQAEPITRHPSYCTQNNGDCSNCPLMVDGVDCHGHINLLEVLEEVNP